VSDAQSFRCACHERQSIRYCPRHGKPLKLLEGERVFHDHDIEFLKLCVDPVKAEAFAKRIREVMSGHI
jgi:hypothetical protein